MAEDTEYLVHEAYLLLTDLEPVLASTFYRHVVLEMEQKEIARQDGVADRTVWRRINGDTIHGQWVPGAREWLTRILELFMEADRSGRFEALLDALSYSRRLNPWGEPFPAVVMEVAEEAARAGALASLLVRLAEAKSAGAYDRMHLTILLVYERGAIAESLLPALAGAGPIAEVLDEIARTIEPEPGRAVSA